jgi:hypothetical protein
MTSHHTIFIIIVVLMMLSSSLLAYDPTQRKQIGIQPHSVNDFRSWPQLLKHEPQYFKIDPNYQPNSFCRQLNSQYYPKSITSDDRGCFLFVHDSPKIINNHYNVTIDFWKLIVENLEYFNRQDRKIYIAVCFKNGGDCDSGWSSLVDEFFEDADMYISKYKLNVEFILDGNGVPSKPCLYKKWLPWNATWIERPVNAMWSNDPDKAFNRYAVMNEPYNPSNIRMHVLKLIHYAKFLQNTMYPFLLWEPDDQSHIQKAITDYLSGMLNPKGLRFAINMDPVQFDIYSKNNWNFPLISDAVNPFITVLKDFTMIVVYGDGMYSGYTSSEVMGQFQTIFVGKKLSQQYSLKKIQSVTSIGQYVMITDSNSTLAIFKYDSNTSELVGVFSTKMEDTSYSASLIYTTGEDTLVFLTYGVSNQHGCALFSQLNVYKNGKINTLDRWCILDSASMITNVTLAATVTSDNALKGVSFYSSNSLVYGCTFSANWDESTLSVTNFHTTCSSKAIGVGRSPSASILSLKGKTYIAQVHTDSYCGNSESHNKNATVSVCDATPVSTRNIMTYTVGEWSDLTNHLSNSNNTFITNCHRQLVHGMYDMGQHPSITLYNHNDQIAAIEVHDGLVEHEFSDHSGCGTAIAYKHSTIVLDSWIVSNLVH